MKRGGSEGDRDEQRLAENYGSSHPDTVIGSGQSRFVGFSQDYETVQTHAFRTNCPHHFMNESVLSLVKNARGLPPLAERLQTDDWLRRCQSVRSSRSRPHMSHWSVLGVLSASSCSEPVKKQQQQKRCGETPQRARTHPWCSANL